MISVTDFMQKLPEKAKLDWLKLTAEREAVDSIQSDYVFLWNPCIMSVN